MNRTEIHFHLLPGLDDGPETMEDTLELARAAAAEGTSAIVATPHVRGDFVTDVSVLPDLVREVQERIDGEALGITVSCGAELGADMVGRLDQTELETVAAGPRGRRWLLLETPFGGIGEHFHAAAQELRERGFTVVLAHPERSVTLFDHRSLELRRELSRGSLLQVNGGSLLGHHGPEVKRAALRLVRIGLVGAVASDAHSIRRGRTPLLAAARTAMREDGVPARRAEHLTGPAPAQLVAHGVRRHVPRVPAAA